MPRLCLFCSLSISLSHTSGCSYDFVELYTELLAWPEDERTAALSTLTEEEKKEYERLGQLIEGIHRRNKHKEVYPLDLNVL